MESNQTQTVKNMLDINSGTKADLSTISLETEVSEVLYKGMNEFIENNPRWDQYQLMSSAIANFLFQNGSTNRVVLEKYLNDIFRLSDS